MVLVVGWPTAILLSSLAMMMALHFARMEAPTDKEWFIFVCLVVKIKCCYLQLLSIGKDIDYIITNATHHIMSLPHQDPSS